MKKEYRIKKNSEIDAIFKKKTSKSNSYYAIYQSTDPQASHFRFALSIGKKYGNAVKRNLAKRRIRMIVTEQSNHMKSDVCFVIVIKPNSKDLSYNDMKYQLIELMKKSKLLENTDE
ncbi:MAG: ribonuclease P protein component [Acholeplasmataceae bacterium]|jgi:ribonuclease P protein component|nr:ribonuclease P protein component [Acholeplasmataceae bacterium]MDD4193842.1 ribonuclease P protein component [Acholeplasmataceae bacterium]MDY0338228.1 ribonuclease P protein component [Acholeplasmataceae bacterium]